MSNLNLSFTIVTGRKICLNATSQSVTLTPASEDGKDDTQHKNVKGAAKENSGNIMKLPSHQVRS